MDGRENMPDPAGPPEASSESWCGAVGQAALIAIVAGVGVAYVMGITTTHTRGATISAQLEWESRQQQIDDAMREAGTEGRDER